MTTRHYFVAAKARQARADGPLPLLTVDEVREHLKLPSTRAVYRLVAAGMPVRHVGQRLRFSPAELDQWMCRHRVA